MSTTQTEDPVSRRILVTEAATSRIASLLSGEASPDLYLRLFVRGGGCGGFQYGFEFDDRTDCNDLTLRKNGAVLRIDPMSYQNLLGATIDYRQNPDGEGFVIDNPNETTGSCSCGTACDADR